MLERDTVIYNNIWKENNKYSDVSEEVMSLAKDGKMALDLCAGGGRHSKYLVENGFEVFAVDRNAIAIQELKKYGENNPLLKVINSDAVEYLKKDNHLYDLIIVFDCVHHFCLTKKDLKKTVDSLYEKMNPGAKILITFLSDISYPGGNGNVRRLFLNEESANKLLDSCFSSRFMQITHKREQVHFSEAENLIDGKLIKGDYRANRLIRVYKKVSLEDESSVKPLA
ncbi:hypothetical protein DOK67_0000679 [Enterococcus sp. DIV0212c]|uniref:class I SAM-dependent methyltransferase n=1 Tax=Enterococcus sp. DIV0212c TaxID=2230867 RepID=UPI001A9B9933|nr:class I SAM-dependent methyltransferase [Enterococcus sp. DIV0212c]MBO1354670.1 class I SAM-dependent methyltransferase [Enterococcus sp. DIV0212c]